MADARTRAMDLPNLDCVMVSNPAARTAPIWLFCAACLGGDFAADLVAEG
jgi:hypothetical protein